MDQALAEDFEADKLDYLQHVHEELPSLSVFNMITYLRNSSQNKMLYFHCLWILAI